MVHAVIRSVLQQIPEAHHVGTIRGMQLELDIPKEIRVGQRRMCASTVLHVSINASAVG